MRTTHPQKLFFIYISGRNIVFREQKRGTDFAVYRLLLHCFTMIYSSGQSFFHFIQLRIMFILSRDFVYITIGATFSLF